MRNINLSVVIPTYNERKRLPKTFEAIIAYLKSKQIPSEVIISDDGSTDGTLNYAKSLQGVSDLIEVRTIAEPVRRGKGAGVKRGILASRGQWVIFMDADNSTDLSEIEKFKPYQKDYEIIIGSRYLGVKQEVKQNVLRQLISRFGALMVRVFTGLNYRDTQCGFKIFSQEAARKIFTLLEGTGWGFDVEVLFLAKKLGYPTKEVGVVWRDAEGSHLRSGFDSIKTFFEVLAISKRVKPDVRKTQSKNK